MATTFEVFLPGTAADLHPTEGNNDIENATAIVGSTFGSVGDPLSQHGQTFSPGSNGFGSGGNTPAGDTNNTACNGNFKTNVAVSESANFGCLDGDP